MESQSQKIVLFLFHNFCVNKFLTAIITITVKFTDIYSFKKTSSFNFLDSNISCLYSSFHTFAKK